MDWNRETLTQIERFEKNWAKRLERYDRTNEHLDIRASVAESVLNEFHHIKCYVNHAIEHYLDNVIGVEEASEILGLSPGTVKNYCAEGKLAAKKIGKTWVLDRTKLEEDNNGH